MLSHRRSTGVFPGILTFPFFPHSDITCARPRLDPCFHDTVPLLRSDWVYAKVTVKRGHVPQLVRPSVDQLECNRPF